MSRRKVLGALLGTIAVLGAIAVVGMLDPPVESRAAVGVPFDHDGPVAQPFEAHGLEGWVVHYEDGSTRAFSAASPHRRCRVIFVAPGDQRYEHAQWEPRHEAGLFFDVCFNSMWTLDGTRTFGPTPRGLDEFGVTNVEDGLVFLDLRRVQLGECGEGVVSGSWCSRPDQLNHQRPSAVRAPGSMWQ